MGPLSVWGDMRGLLNIFDALIAALLGRPKGLTRLIMPPLHLLLLAVVLAFGVLISNHVHAQEFPYV